VRLRKPWRGHSWYSATSRDFVRVKGLRGVCRRELAESRNCLGLHIAVSELRLAQRRERQRLSGEDHLAHLRDVLVFLRIVMKLAANDTDRDRDPAHIPRHYLIRLV